tara:strand:+ start:6386 stop:6634 length:249 start_codon:yes stop_codon:yes gene_type:complete
MRKLILLAALTVACSPESIEEIEMITEINDCFERRSWTINDTTIITLNNPSEYVQGHAWTTPGATCYVVCDGGRIITKTNCT